VDTLFVAALSRGSDVTSLLQISSQRRLKMKIALASDHAGFEEKEKLKPLLKSLGVEFEDLGTASEDSVDYPDYALKVAESVAKGEAEQGLLVCGSGTGMAITANKVPGVRAAVAWSEEIARLARQHNDANVLSIGARVTPEADIPKIVKAWFASTFEGGRHASRVAKIKEIERQCRAEGQHAGIQGQEEQAGIQGQEQQAGAGRRQ
jgi:ribose 5-phosphate isomerase B